MKYGVSNRCHIFAVGVTNRAVAKTISEYYYTKAGKGNVPSMEERYFKKLI